RKDPSRRLLMLGRGSENFAAILRKEYPDLFSQIWAAGPLPADDLAENLAACDCVLQPFSDGVNSRHTSLLASLALGLPIVTNHGPLTDPVWHKTDAIVLAPAASPVDFLEAVERLLAEPDSWKDLGHRAVNFYQQHFSLARTIHTLREEAGNC